MGWLTLLFSIAAFALLLIGILLAAVFLYLFKVYSRLSLDELPVAAGARGDNFEVRSAKGVPYLWSYGLPYPTDCDETGHRVQMLTGHWEMKFDPDAIGEMERWHTLSINGNWIGVSVPFTYNAAESPHTAYEGYTWFCKRFRLSFRRKENHFIRLCFRGVLLRCTVWLNGKLLGVREGGYTPFYFDVSEHIQEGMENFLVVRSDNRLTEVSLPPRIRADHNPGWHTYGGIYRDVYLELIPETYVFKVDARPEVNDDHAALAVDILVHNRRIRRPYSLSCTVADQGHTVGHERIESRTPGKVERHSFTVRIARPKLWSPESPHLYDVRLSLKSKGIREDLLVKTGMRTVSVEGESLLLNGKQIFLKGICKHEDDPEAGATQTDDIIKRDLSLIRRMGANYIRMAHYPHRSKELLRARDMGFLLSEEIPLYQAGVGFTAWYEEKKSIALFPHRLFGMKQMSNRELLLNAQRELIEMIERDRNNPAVILWSAGNECYTLFEGGKIFGWLRSVAKAFDPTRPVTMAELTYNIPILDRSRTTARYMDVISLNTYYGWYYGRTDGIGPHLDRFHRRYPGKPVILSEFGAGAAPGRSESNGVWKAERVDYGKTYSEEYQEKVMIDYWNTVQERKHVVGVSPWVFSDFYNTWFPNNPVPCYNLKGVTSRERVPKRSYHQLKKLYRKK